MELLHAAPYERQGAQHAGKTHAIREGERTYCGTELRYTGGSISTGEREAVSCKGCMRSLDSADNQERQKQEWEQRSAELARQREEKDAEWWATYNKYLESPQWAQRRHQVLTRANWLCEGCRINQAVQAHHLTYEHVTNELLFELVAVCKPCHQIAHPNKVI